MVYVYFTHFGFAFILFGELIYYRAYHAARATPLCPKVDEYYLVGIEHFGLEVVICEFHCHNIGLYLLCD